MVSVFKVKSIAASFRRVWCVAWSHKGDILASCGEDRSISLWSEAADGSWNSYCVAPGSHKRSIRHISWSPCDTYLATASFDGTVVIWKCLRDDTSMELEALATLEGHTSEVKCVAWSASGHLLASCGRDKSVWFWEFDDEEDVQCVSVLQPHSQDVKSVSWHPTEEILVSCSYDNTINLYREELDDWVVVVQLRGHTSTVWKAEFSPKGNILASCSDDRTMKLWSTTDGADKCKSSNWFCLTTLSGYHTDTIFDLSWSPDGQMLASGGADNRLCIFQLSSADLLNVAGRPEFIDPPVLWGHVPAAHPEDINSVHWRPPSASRCLTNIHLCTAGDDGVINFWSIHSDGLRMTEGDLE
ncbi:probable cytosolic iron-sulfur protein assembly protein [Clonorchis sinensis]|uniref:Probable cytosolic iron-sulfur protein assembly protein CIAO1 homolog n=1 Tax=Clonorchis sinensis TaxID=79923 RepID=G7YPN3_CLOSI|nr:probable cytosolic iron-sulfur protein assembly protein [Clonorchis sinensis]